MRMGMALGLMLVAVPLAAMAQGTLPPERTNPSPNDPSIGAPAAPSSMGNPAASTTTSMPAETGGGTVPGSGAEGSKTGDAGKK